MNSPVDPAEGQPHSQSPTNEIAVRPQSGSIHTAPRDFGDKVVVVDASAEEVVRLSVQRSEVVLIRSSESDSDPA